MSTHRLLIVVDLALLAFHSLEQVLFHRVHGERAILREYLDDHERREQVETLDVGQYLHHVLFAVELFAFAEILQRENPQRRLLGAVFLARLEYVGVLVVVHVVLQDALIHAVLFVQKQQSRLCKINQNVFLTLFELKSLFFE